MKVTTLLENTKVCGELDCHHGLSFYIETKKHKILFDMGQNDAFFNNAKKLGIKLEDVDIAFISHGHFDHGRGLGKFLEMNTKAKVYVSQYGFEHHYSSDDVPGCYKYIGLPMELKNSDRIVLTTDTLKIDDELSVYSGIKSVEYVSAVNKSLCSLEYNELGKNNDGLDIADYDAEYQPEDLEKYGKIVIDDFKHEQNLVINEDGGEVALIAGCCHTGVVNIMTQVEERSGLKIDRAFGGFHLFLKTALNRVSDEFIQKLAQKLLQYNATYYTGHCTGVEEFKKLQAIMGDRAFYCATGTKFEF